MSFADSRPSPRLEVQRWVPRPTRIGRSLVWAISLGLACDNSESAPIDSAAVQAPVVEAITPADSITIALTGPTLIAFYPAVPAAGPDTSEEMSTVMDDFSHHLSTASDSLRAIGFRIELRPADSIVVSHAGRAIAVNLPKDSADVGYYFAAPGRAPLIIYGVRTNMDLVQSGRAFLASNP